MATSTNIHPEIKLRWCRSVSCRAQEVWLVLTSVTGTRVSLTWIPHLGWYEAPPTPIPCGLHSGFILIADKVREGGRLVDQERDYPIEPFHVVPHKFAVELFLRSEEPAPFWPHLPQLRRRYLSCDIFPDHSSPLPISNRKWRSSVALAPTHPHNSRDDDAGLTRAGSHGHLQPTSTSLTSLREPEQAWASAPALSRAFRVAAQLSRTGSRVLPGLSSTSSGVCLIPGDLSGPTSPESVGLTTEDTSPAWSPRGPPLRLQDLATEEGTGRGLRRCADASSFEDLLGAISAARRATFKTELNLLRFDSQAQDRLVREVLAASDSDFEDEEGEVDAEEGHYGCVITFESRSTSMEDVGSPRALEAALVSLTSTDSSRDQPAPAPSESDHVVGSEPRAAPQSWTVTPATDSQSDSVEAREAWMGREWLDVPGRPTPLPRMTSRTTPDLAEDINFQYDSLSHDHHKLPLDISHLDSEDSLEAAPRHRPLLQHRPPQHQAEGDSEHVDESEDGSESEVGGLGGKYEVVGGEATYTSIEGEVATDPIPLIPTVTQPSHPPTLPSHASPPYLPTPPLISPTSPPHIPTTLPPLPTVPPRHPTVPPPLPPTTQPPLIPTTKPPLVPTTQPPFIPTTQPPLIPTTQPRPPTTSSYLPTAPPLIPITPTHPTAPPLSPPSPDQATPAPSERSGDEVLDLLDIALRELDDEEGGKELTDREGGVREGEKARSEMDELGEGKTKREVIEVEINRASGKEIGGKETPGGREISEGWIETSVRREETIGEGKKVDEKRKTEIGDEGKSGSAKDTEKLVDIDTEGISSEKVEDKVTPYVISEGDSESVEEAIIELDVEEEMSGNDGEGERITGAESENVEGGESEEMGGGKREKKEKEGEEVKEGSEIGIEGEEMKEKSEGIPEESEIRGKMEEESEGSEIRGRERKETKDGSKGMKDEESGVLEDEHIVEKENEEVEEGGSEYDEGGESGDAREDFDDELEDSDFIVDEGNEAAGGLSPDNEFDPISNGAEENIVEGSELLSEENDDYDDDDEGEEVEENGDEEEYENGDEEYENGDEEGDENYEDEDEEFSEDDRTKDLNERELIRTKISEPGDENISVIGENSGEGRSVDVVKPAEKPEEDIRNGNTSKDGKVGEGAVVRRNVRNGGRERSEGEGKGGDGRGGMEGRRVIRANDRGLRIDGKKVTIRKEVIGREGGGGERRDTEGGRERIASEGQRGRNRYTEGERSRRGERIPRDRTTVKERDRISERREEGEKMADRERRKGEGKGKSERSSTQPSSTPLPPSTTTSYIPPSTYSYTPLPRTPHTHIPVHPSPYSSSPHIHTSYTPSPQLPYSPIPHIPPTPSPLITPSKSSSSPLRRTKTEVPYTPLPDRLNGPWSQRLNKSTGPAFSPNPTLAALQRNLYARVKGDIRPFHLSASHNPIYNYNNNNQNLRTASIDQSSYNLSSNTRRHLVSNNNSRNIYNTDYQHSTTYNNNQHSNYQNSKDYQKSSYQHSKNYHSNLINNNYHFGSNPKYPVINSSLVRSSSTLALASNLSTSRDLLPTTTSTTAGEGRSRGSSDDLRRSHLTSKFSKYSSVRGASSLPELHQQTPRHNSTPDKGIHNPTPPPPHRTQSARDLSNMRGRRWRGRGLGEASDSGGSTDSLIEEAEDAASTPLHPSLFHPHHPVSTTVSATKHYASVSNILQHSYAEIDVRDKRSSRRYRRRTRSHHGEFPDTPRQAPDTTMTPSSRWTDDGDGEGRPFLPYRMDQLGPGQQVKVLAPGGGVAVARVLASLPSPVRRRRDAVGSDAQDSVTVILLSEPNKLQGSVVTVPLEKVLLAWPRA